MGAAWTRHAMCESAFSVLCWFRTVLYCVNNLCNLNLYCSSTRILSFSQCVYDHADTFDNTALECSMKGKVSALWFSGGVLEIIWVPAFMNSEQPVPHTPAGKDKGLSVRRTSEGVSCHLSCEHAQSTTFILMKPERCEQRHTTNDSVLRNLKNG